jgi:hypothetical protein
MSSWEEEPAPGKRCRPETNAETGWGRISEGHGIARRRTPQTPDTTPPFPLQAPPPRPAKVIPDGSRSPDDAARRAGWVGAASDGGQGLRAPHPARVAPGHGYPVLDAWNWGVEALAWCPRCERWHIHGAQWPDEPIRLLAHCYRAGGYSSYVLELNGRATREMVADAFRRHQIGPAACLERHRLRARGLYPTKRRRKRRTRC